MSPQELQDIVDRYGEDPEDWPESRRAPARELIDDCAEARAIIVQAKVLRALLRNMAPATPACFTDHIISLALELDPPLTDRYRRRN